MNNFELKLNRGIIVFLVLFGFAIQVPAFLLINLYFDKSIEGDGAISIILGSLFLLFGLLILVGVMQTKRYKIYNSNIFVYNIFGRRIDEFYKNDIIRIQEKRIKSSNEKSTHYISKVKIYTQRKTYKIESILFNSFREFIGKLNELHEVEVI